MTSHGHDRDVVRERTTTWEDPMLTAAQLGRLTGMELLEAVRAGELPAPPIASTLGFDIELVEEGRVVFVLDPAEFHYNPIGSVHGGVMATLLDSALGCAVHSTLPAGVGYTSLDLDVRFLRGITTRTGRVRCEGRVVHSGRRTALAEATITDGDGKLLATGSSSCLVFEVPQG